MKPLHVETAIQVPAAIGTAWDFVAVRYFDNHGRWDPAVIGMAKLTGGPIEVGTTGVETRSFFGKQRARFEVTSFEPRVRFGFRNLTGPFHLDRAYRFAATPGGTTISFSFDMRPKLAARPLFGLIRGQIEAQVIANIDRLAALLR